MIKLFERSVSAAKSFNCFAIYRTKLQQNVLCTVSSTG